MDTGFSSPCKSEVGLDSLCLANMVIKWKTRKQSKEQELLATHAEV